MTRALVVSTTRTKSLYCDSWTPLAKCKLSSRTSVVLCSGS